MWDNEAHEEEKEMLQKEQLMELKKRRDEIVIGTRLYGVGIREFADHYQEVWEVVSNIEEALSLLEIYEGYIVLGELKAELSEDSAIAYVLGVYIGAVRIYSDLLKDDYDCKGLDTEMLSSFFAFVEDIIFSKDRKSVV